MNSLSANYAYLKTLFYVNIDHASANEDFNDICTKYQLSLYRIPNTFCKNIGDVDAILFKHCYLKLVRIPHRPIFRLDDVAEQTSCAGGRHNIMTPPPSS